MQAPIMTLDEGTPKDEPRDLAREAVEQVIDGILDARADELASAGRRGRTDERQACRNGLHTRGLLTRAGRIELPPFYLSLTRGTAP